MNEIFKDLTPKMRERLEKWRQNTLPVKSAEIFKGNPIEKTFDELEREMNDIENKRWNETHKGRL